MARRVYQLRAVLSIITNNLTGQMQQEMRLPKHKVLLAGRRFPAAQQSNDVLSILVTGRLHDRSNNPCFLVSRDQRGIFFSPDRK